MPVKAGFPVEISAEGSAVSPGVYTSSITRGTDLVGVRGGGVPILPVRRGEITARWLGCAVDFFNEKGRSLVGQQGELVCTAPWPTLPIFLRNDPGGVRIGTAEIYGAIEPMPELEDAIVVGRDIGGNEEAILFVKTRTGIPLDEDLEARTRAVIRASVTPRHMPRRIRQVQAIPYTISGKKVEKAVRRILAGDPVLNRDPLADPSTLEEYEEMATQR